MFGALFTLRTTKQKVMRIKLLLIVVIVLAALKMNAQNEATTVYQFEVKSIDGQTFDWNTVKGKKILIVNTASKCGLTPQYEGLEELYNKYKDQNFVILGFPANNFLKQEPGTNEEIKEFCTKNYGVTFPMMSKISVKGDDIDPLYKWLTETSGTDIKWNFQKFLINEEGKIVDFALPKVQPLDAKIVNWIEL